MYYGQILALAPLLKDGSGNDDLGAVHNRSLALIVEARFGDIVVSPHIVKQLRKDYFAVIHESLNISLRPVILQRIF